jgi:hypothetical protein
VCRRVSESELRSESQIKASRALHLQVCAQPFALYKLVYHALPVSVAKSRGSGVEGAWRKQGGEIDRAR